MRIVLRNGPHRHVRLLPDGDVDGGVREDRTVQTTPAFFSRRLLLVCTRPIPVQSSPDPLARSIERFQEYDDVP
jgi:hypothetical protein